MAKANKDLRNAIKSSGVKHWRIADELGISENTLVRWLRYELSDEKRNEIVDAMNRILAHKGKGGNK